MKKLLLITIILLALITVGTVFAAESIKYDFDDVEVKYAAEFTAKPINVDPDNWIVQIAGGVDKPITVLYGVVNLKKDGETQVSEEFIKVSGEGGSEKFLVNSGRYDYYEGTNNYKEIVSLFWSAKKIIDSSVVKDFTLPINSITLFRKFNEDQTLYSIVLSFAGGDKEGAGKDFQSGPSKNVYEADTTTLNQSGIPTTTVSQ